MLIPLTGAFLLGLLFGSFLPYLPCTIASLLLLTAAVLTYLEFRDALSCRRGLLIYAGLLFGILHWTIASNKPLSPSTWTDDGPRRMVGTIVEPIRYAPGRIVLTLEGDRFPSTSRRELSRVRIRATWRNPDRTFFQGDQVELFARVNPPIGLHNPNGFDYAAMAEHRGIHGVVSVMGPDGVRLVAQPSAWSRWWLWHRVDEWRDRVREAAVHDLGQPALGLFLGMVVGMAGYIHSSVRDTFMATGTVHILSISGSHLGLIAFLCFFLVRVTCQRLPSRWLLALSRWMIPTRLAAAVTIVPVGFYTLLAGAEIATVRSCVMIMIFLLAVWLGRRQHLLTALAAAALVILLHDPDALFDLSFQLSYLSVLAIALTALWYGHDNEDGHLAGENAWPRFIRWGRSYMVVTIAVTLVATPLVAYYFNQIAWLGMVGNLIALPLAGFVLVPLGLTSAVWLLASGGTNLPLTTAMESLFSLLTKALELLSAMPGAEWHVAAPTLATMLAFYALMYLAARPHYARVYRLGGALGAIVLVAWWCWSPRHLGDGESVRVTFLDVGQGDASVIELPDGQTVLIDAGAAYDTLDLGRVVVGRFLWNRGIRRIDHVIATHPQRDHVGGLPWIVSEFAIGRYWGSQVPRNEPFYRRLRETLDKHGLPERQAGSGQVILSSGACRLRALNPPGGETMWSIASSLSGKWLNNHSVVTRLDCGQQSFLFAADIELDALEWMTQVGAASPVRVLKVPHHGSRGSIDLDWIRRLRPEVAVISVGRRNHYGHPSPDTIAAYEQHDARVLRTDRDGAISITAKLSSSDLSIQTVRESTLRRVSLDRTVFQKERRNLLMLAAKWSGRYT